MGFVDGVFVAVVLFVIGLIVIAVRRDLIIKLLALGLLNASTILLLVSLRVSPSDQAPILPVASFATVADPLPQALVLTAIVINFAILALSLVFVMLLVERYHTTDSVRIERDVHDEEASE